MERRRGPVTPEQDALEHIAACRDKPFLKESFIDSFKGRGVFTLKAIKPSSFVVEYRGNTFSHQDTVPTKKPDNTLNDYLLEFSWNGEDWCIDASKEDGTLGRLVNDDHINSNCEMRTVVFEGKPHLCLFAVREISPGEEITYNYGDSSYPWRSKLDDSVAASSSENSCSDDDVLPDSGPNYDAGGFSNISSQLDLRDHSSLTEFDSSQDMTVQPDGASCTQLEDEAASTCDDTDLGEDKPRNPARKPRGPSYTNKNYCYVCGVGFAKLARHLLRHAYEEPDIAEAFSFPKNSKERKKLLERLRNRGNYKHNEEVLRNNSGKLKLRRRPKTTVTIGKAYAHCPNCKGMYERKGMWRHVAKCLSSQSATGGKTKVLSEISLEESQFSQSFPYSVWKMLVSMKQDEIAFVVQNDSRLLQLAQYLSEKYENKPKKHNYIQQRLREMGRLLLALREKSIFSFEEAIKPNNFYKVVEAVKSICGFDENMQTYSKPSLALKLRHLLKKVCAIVLSEVSDNEEQMRDAKTFMKLCAKEWSEPGSQTAVAPLSGQKVNNPSTIPFTRDVQVFYRYLEKTSVSATELLKKNENLQVYDALCTVTLAQTSVLSKCAPEVSKMTLKAFQERDDSTQVLSRHFIRINIQGRTGQNVAVLLTSELVSAITLLVSKRTACGVHQDNPFLFAKPDSSPTSFYHGGKCIRAFSSLCCVKNPEHLRSMHFNKHIARIFQILNLENDELSHLARLLGHDIRADRDYYRLPEAAVELTKVAKLILAMEKGSLERFKGNSLEEIKIDDELEPDVQQANPEVSDSEDGDEESDLLLKQSDAAEQQGRQLTPMQDALEHIKACRDKSCLEEMLIDSYKGRGVFTRELIQPSTFVVEYRGNIFSLKETRRKKHGGALNNYLFDFLWNGTNWRVDASKEDGSLGRLVNDDHRSPNCKIKKVVFEGKPHLCLFAVREISPGEEITYNYGDSSYPWRSKELNTSQKDMNATASSTEDEHVEDSAGLFSSAESSCDESVFLPDTDPSGDDNSTSNNKQQCLNSQSDSHQQSFVQKSVDALCTDEEDDADSSLDDFNSDAEPGDPSCTNKNFCYICGKAQTKISRHLFTHRKEDPDIAKVFALPIHSKERSKLLDKLRNRGNYKHNNKVLKARSGELKVKRNSKMSTDAKKFALCLYCKCLFGRKEMWRHMQKCPFKKSSKAPTCGRNRVLLLVADSALTNSKNISSDLRKALKKMKKDEIASVVFNDPHILKLAQCLCYKKDGKTKSCEYITQCLRTMGRLLLTLRKKSICSFEDALKPTNFSRVVEAVRELSGFNEEKMSYSSPSLMKRLVHLLRKIGDIKFARALKEDTDKHTVYEAQTFRKLCEDEWSIKHLAKANISNPPTVPFTQDVQLFYQCLEKTTASAVQSLTMYESPQVYNALLRVTLAHVSVLNKNVAEVSKATLKSFNERVETELEEDAPAHQSQFEQILSKRSVKIRLMSKNVEKLVVTLTPTLLTAITLLVSKRDSCGVHKNNPFLFARPAAICVSFCHGHRCINMFAARCGANNTAHLRSVFFRKHVSRIFQILSLTSDELEQVAKLLGRSIRTDSEYYQMPEAAVDIAKISELLSAAEKGALERFKGKSLEELEIADELEPDLEQNIPLLHFEIFDTEEDNEEPENPLQLSGSFSTRKKPSRVSSTRKLGQGRSRMEESENDAFELDDEEDTEKGDRSEETPEETLSHSNADASNISFSDDDGDMQVDFDSDELSVRNEDNDEEEHSNSSATAPLTPDANNVTMEDIDNSDIKTRDSLLDKKNPTAEHEETMEFDVEKEGLNEVGKESDCTDEDSRGPSATLNTEKETFSAAVTIMKEVKILVPKLNIEKLKAPVHISQLSSVCNSVKQPVKDDNNQRRTSLTSDVKNKPSSAKVVQMICSHCNKIMLKGQTAYQKKGYTDVFCSKDCLFELFPINKPAAKICYFCLKAISQPLDLIMAAVDVKGTLKDFCSVTCLSSFKAKTCQSPQSVCSSCSESCIVAIELTLNAAVHKFCSDPCLEDFRRHNMFVCENCSSPSYSIPLRLKVEEVTKTICSETCLKELKKKIKTPHPCTMCHTCVPTSRMIHYKSNDNTVDLFCTHTCVSSYRLRPQDVDNLQGKTGSARLKNSKTDKQFNQNLSTETTSDSSANKNDVRIPSFNFADTCVLCCLCGKKLLRGETRYQPKNSLEVFCSASCLSEKHPQTQNFTKNCYFCHQLIMRPHSVILAPVDDSGTMKELCSSTCLASVNSKRNTSALKPPPRFECKICAKFCSCKFSRTVDGLQHKICSDTCFVSYCKLNNLPVFKCDNCSCISNSKCFTLKMEDSSKTICSEECLVKFKEKIETPQLCPMCQTSHQMSDMVESESSEGSLEFFCNSRCMMVHRAQCWTASGGNSQTFDEDDMKEVKPLLPSVDCIKQEPTDEGYSQNLPSSVSTEDIKDEPNAAKEDLNIGSVFSLKGDSTPTAPPLTHMDLSSSCSNCKDVLRDGETVYQRKGHADIFCSSSCLLKFYQKIQVKKICHFCLQAITQPQNVIQAPGDTEGTIKDFCSQTCLSSFNYKRIMSTKIPIVPVASQSQCSMCSRYCISKHEVIQQDVIHKICSDPCFLRFCNMNNFSVCENCHSHCSRPLILKMEHGSQKLCRTECLTEFKQKNKTPQPCAMCCTSHLMSDMVDNKNSEGLVELFCNNNCMMASKIQAVSAAGIPLNCDDCGKTTVPACHLAMSDTSIRNFCSLSCAMAFKETQKDLNTATKPPDQTQCALLKPPEKLLCAQCRRILRSTPKVVQKKGKMNFVCSLACSQEFKRVNNILGKCEFCKNERIIRDAMRVDSKDCYFCSDGCKVLFRHELEKAWGEYCRSCSYCLSISKTVVMAHYDGTEQEFCSEDCNLKYKMLFCHVARCDTCGHEGKLRQSLPMLGEVKHFCDMKCLLHFCNKKVQMVNTASPPACAGAAGSSPVITNVISLASALAQHSSASARSAQLVSVPDSQTKVVGHASVQTVPKEVKNKSMLCTPLVHNKGVSCTVQTVDTGAQTDNIFPEVTALPLPVPVYVPLPMNMYSQYTPTPVGLPLPLLVPIFLPVKPDSPDQAVKSMKEAIQSDPFEGELNILSNMDKVQEKRNEREEEQRDRVMTKEGQRQELHAQDDHTSSCRDDLDANHQPTFNTQEDSDSRFESFSRPHGHEKPPPVLEEGMPSEPRPELPLPGSPPNRETREDPQSSQSPATISPLLQPSVETGHNKNKGGKLQQLTKAAKEETSQRHFSKVTFRRHHKVKSQCGTDAWRRWIQWRESQSNLGSSHVLTLNKDVLHCSASELSDALCCFITEVRQPDGEPYSPDSVFYLCLCIQQYLFDNGRLENIFSDMTYNKFSTEFTNMLRGFKPSVTASGYIHSRVEEEFLWDCKQLGAYSPIVLLNTLLFFCCKYFGFTTVEQNRQLSFAHVMRCTKTNQDNTKTTFLRFYPPISINEAESDAYGVPAKKRKKNESMDNVLEMMENTENPLRCPVRLYEFYVSKCSASVRQRVDMFYLCPDQDCVPNSPVWFSSTPLDDGTMEAMLVRILAVQELQGGDGRSVHQQTSDDELDSE